MKHVKLFQNKAAFDAEKETLVKPWLALAKQSGLFYSYQKKQQEEEQPKDPQIELVDLGLPSGTLWAKCNLGAENEYDYGKYFAWGDTVGFYADEAPTDAGLWSAFPFNQGQEEFTADYFKEHMMEWMTLSPTSPNKPNDKFPEFTITEEIINPEYDAATVAYGAGYCMPTADDFTELLNNTDGEWDEEHKCMKITSKINGNYIIIPFGGDFSDFSNGELEYASEMGNYWSSTHYTDVDNYGGCYWDSAYQMGWSYWRGNVDGMLFPFPMNMACSIRPVKKA